MSFGVRDDRSRSDLSLRPPARQAPTSWSPSGRFGAGERGTARCCGTWIGPTPVLRSDNALIFQSRRFRAACRDYRVRQEFVTPYTPEQNGLIERFFRSLKEECVWFRTFRSFLD